MHLPPPTPPLAAALISTHPTESIQTKSLPESLHIAPPSSPVSRLLVLTKRAPKEPGGDVARCVASVWRLWCCSVRPILRRRCSCFNEPQLMMSSSLAGGRVNPRMKDLNHNWCGGRSYAVPPVNEPCGGPRPSLPPAAPTPSPHCHVVYIRPCGLGT